MDVFKCKNDNALAAPLRSQIFENFEKMKNFQENIEDFRNFGIFSEKRVVWDEEALYEFSVRKLG